MSILITGMELPPKGMRLFVAVNGCGDVYLMTAGEEIITKYQPSAKAIELPPHGRLIDADALRSNIYDSLTKQFYINQKQIEDAPTIIPADPEGGENNG